MKRFLLHFIFWFVYSIQASLLEMVWMEPLLQDYTQWQQWWIGVHMILSLNIPQILLAYYLMYITVNRVLKDEGKLWVNLAMAGLMSVLAVLLYRIIFNYYIIPYAIYNLAPKRELLDVSRTLLAVMDIGFAAGVAVAMRLARIQLAGKEREKKLLQEKHATELKYLRNQTNPHFLFNTLNNIYALARKRSEDTAEVVMKLSKLLRFMLYESNKNLILLTDEIRMLDDYLELEKIRYSDRLTITFYKELDSETEMVAPLLLLPFVENAFKHGVSETRFDSYVYITLNLKKGVLNFTIENTKGDSGKEIITDNIGLSNVRRQLELMYQHHSLEVINQSNTFKVQLTINLNNHANLALSHSGR